MMMVLAAEVEPELAPLSSGTSLLVALLALVFAFLAFRAHARKRNRGLLVVGVAFLIFAAKSAFSAYNVLTHAVPHDLIELALSLFDLVLIVLLFLPFLLRKRGP